MKRARLRPRYSFTVPLRKEVVINKLKRAIETGEPGIEGKFVKPLVIISVKEEDRHFWSPELSLDVEAEGETTEVRCVLGPRSSLWTMFASFYAFSVLVGISGLVLGISQMGLGMRPWGLWFLPASAVLLASAYGIALTGQKVAYDQMTRLRSFVEDIFRNDQIS